MRWIYFWVLAVSGAVWTTAPVSPAVAASAASPADRTRIALLIYQSQSARQADLRRGDAFTRALRTKVSAAEKLASTTRAQLASARAEGLQARRVATALASKLEHQERALAETAEKYTAELAKRDEEYARERSILISTGERLLKTNEGRQLLDLFNAGGEANWKEARTILNESRRVRRALDARDAAILYLRARWRGHEQTANVIPVYEEVVKDDPQANDWITLAALYGEVGDIAKAKQAANRAEALARSDADRGQVWLEMASVERRFNCCKGSLPFYDQGIAALEKHLRANPKDTASRFVLAKGLINSAETLLWVAYFDETHEPSLAEIARTRLRAGVDQTTTVIAAGSQINARMLLIRAKVMQGEIFRLAEDKELMAQPYFDEAIQIGRSWMRDNPESIFARENLVFALHAKATSLTRPQKSPWRTPVQDAPIFEAIFAETLQILTSLKRDDPSSTFYDDQIKDDSEMLALARVALQSAKPLR